MNIKRKRKHISGALRRKLFDANNELCSVCGEKTVLFKCYCWDTFYRNYTHVGHVDHIIPFADGGDCDETNYRWVCEPCNYKKNIGRKRNDIKS